VLVEIDPSDNPFDRSFQLGTVVAKISDEGALFLDLDHRHNRVYRIKKIEELLSINFPKNPGIVVYTLYNSMNYRLIKSRNCCLATAL